MDTRFTMRKALWMSGCSCGDLFCEAMARLLPIPEIPFHITDATEDAKRFFVQAIQKIVA